MAYERLNLTTGDLLDAEVFRKIDDGLHELLGAKYELSPNLWSIKLAITDMTDKFYTSGGVPYDSEAFGKQFPCTEKIYLKDYAPQGETRAVDMKRDTNYTFYCIPSLPNGYNTPWGTSLSHKLFFYDESDTFLSTGFVSGSTNTILVPSTATHFRFNIHTFPSDTARDINAVLSAMSTSLMVVEGTKIPEVYYANGERIETPTGSVFRLINDFYEDSPNLWGVKLTTEHLTGQYYMQGAPYTDTSFNNRYQATEKIYLQSYAPENAELVVNLIQGETYRFYSIPTLPNKETTPWAATLPSHSRIFFYDASDNRLGYGFVDSSTVDTIKVPQGSVYFRFNVSAINSTFPAVLSAMNDSLMVVKADIEMPTKYSACGEMMLKEIVGSGGAGIETRPIFYSITNDVVDIISHYNSTHDLRYNMLKKGPNSIFDYGKFYLIPVTATGEVSNDISGDSYSWNWGSTDSHAPWVIRAVNNGDGDNLNDDGTAHKTYFTGGNHGYDNTGATENNPATGRTATVKLYADGKEVVNGSGYCNQVKVCWDNYIQAYNTTKVDGTGREVLREVHESIFDGYEWKEEINIYPLEEIVVSTWYGIQGIGLGGAWKKGYFQGAKEFEANRSLLDSSNGTMTGNSNSKTSNRFVGFDETKSFELEIDPDYDLGSGYLSNSTFKCFISGSKVYFWIIKTDKTLLPNTNYGLKAFYRFKPVTTD